MKPGRYTEPRNPRPWLIHGTLCARDANICKTIEDHWIFLLALLIPESALAGTVHGLDLAGHQVGYTALALFCLAYLPVMAEEFTNMRKSKPVMLAAGVALMGQVRGKYTFFTHLKRTPVIAPGYAADVMTHLWIKADTYSTAIRAH